VTKPQEPEGYASPAMLERRKRILAETRALVSEKGIEGWSLAELAARAGVSRQTFYYAFGGKEDVIAAAILDYFEEYERVIPYRAAPGSIDRLIERIVAIGHRNLTIRNYVAALITIYYGRSPELWRTMHDVSSRPHQATIDALTAARQLQPWVDPAALAEMMVGQTILIANAWLQGRIADAAMIDRMALAVLTELAGSAREETRARIETTIRRIAAGGADAYIAAI